MHSESPLEVVLCWHFHQPDYRDPLSREYQQPWTYLHTIKDYVGMVGHLEAQPDARVVVNFSPILLEQIDDYVQQIKAYQANQDAIHDPLLAALVAPVMPTSSDSQHALIRQALRANKERLIDRFPRYQRLAEIAHWLESNPDEIAYLNQQYLIDLLVWYHLAWISESERDNEVVARLSVKASEFSLVDRCALLGVIERSLSTVLTRYKTLVQRGQIELSVTPYSHPIMPLLLDTNSALAALPELKLPANDSYPGGEQRLRWQLTKGIDMFEQAFGFSPQGCWPSEGAVCPETLRLLDEFNFSWAASGTTVLANSIAQSHGQVAENKTEYLYQPYQFSSQSIKCFFRDDHLSDLIGFTYSDWHANDAVANFIGELETIAEQVDTSNSVVSVILDGENAWEYFHHNGDDFIRALYQKLVEHPGIKLSTFSDALRHQASRLDTLVAGSWVYGTLSTWIGDEQKNRAWEILIEAKKCFDESVQADDLDKVRVEKQLAICESSDWFWWFGDYNPADSVSDFDRLFRMHVGHLYKLLGRLPPDYLLEQFGHGSGQPEHGGTMRHGSG